MGNAPGFFVPCMTVRIGISIKWDGGKTSLAESVATRALCALGAILLAIGSRPGMAPGQPDAAPQQPANELQQRSATLSQHIDPQARQMLDRTIQGLGGQAFLNARSLTTKGRAFFFQDGETAGMQPYQSTMLYPDKRRFSYGKSKPVILINNGDKGWELDRYGLISQPEQQLQGWILSNRYSLENLLRLRINEPGVLIQMGKADFVDNVPTQGLDITAPGGISVRLDLQRHTRFPNRITYRVRNAKEDYWDDYADTYADYKPIDGVQTPMHITHYLNGNRIGENFRNFAQYNEDYPLKDFTPE
jgi:hypothetical protein